MSGLLALLLTNAMPILGSLITAGLGYLLTLMKSKLAADTASSKAATALLKLGTIGAALLQKAWTDLGPVLQAAFADGKFDDSDRAKVEAAVAKLLPQVTDEATLAEISTALGLPMAGIIAKVASWLIQKWTEAHDPEIDTGSAKNFPVAPMVATSNVVMGGLTEAERASADAGG